MISSRFVPVVLLLVGFLNASAAAQGVAPANKRLTAALEPFVDNHKMAGAVTLVADKERILTIDAVGFADLASKRPMKPDAMFWIASMSKSFAGTAVMMLVDEGGLSLDDPLSKHLPEFKDLWVAVEKDEEHMLLKRPKRAVTVRDILSHTSGMGRASPIDEPTHDATPLAARVRGYALSPLETQPGEAYLYSNIGIATAGRVVEVVSGRPYDEYLDERLIKPLGMTDTTFYPSAAQVARLASAYRWNEAGTALEDAHPLQYIRPYGDHTKRHPVPSGGLFSTAADCAKFCQMIMNGGTLDGRRYLSEASVKEMTRRQTTPETGGGYGLGWMVNPGGFGHGGAWATNMSIDPDDGLVMIFLVQIAGPRGAGREPLAAFRAAALEQFGKAAK